MSSLPKQVDVFDDSEDWDFDSVQIQVPVKNPRAIVPVAFDRQEFDEIAAAARRHGLTLTAFIRQAALGKSASPEAKSGDHIREVPPKHSSGSGTRKYLKLVNVESIGPAYAERLEAAGVTSVEQLLKAGASAAGRKTLADNSGIDENKLLEWVNHADLMRIKGVGSEYSDLLEAVGVDTVVELANRNAQNLHAKMAEVNATKKLVRRDPSLSEVQRWVAEAKTLDRIVTH